jgi:hypothetical protein
VVSITPLKLILATFFGDFGDYLGKNDAVCKTVLAC